MAEGHADEQASAEQHRRGLKFRRREDYAVELFREAQGKLHDPERIDRILVELGRFYNPYVDAPIVDAATRRSVLEALQNGDHAAARRLLAARLALYAPAEVPETPDGGHAPA